MQKGEQGFIFYIFLREVNEISWEKCYILAQFFNYFTEKSEWN